MRDGNWREVPRKELARTLNDSIASHYLTVVVAPAGYGKTAMAQKLTGQKQRQRFFHSIPEEISGVAHWWDSLFESLTSQGMEHAPAIRRIGFPQNASTTRRAIELLESVSTPFVLILDDFHNFTNPAIDMFIEAVVRAKPSGHRFALLSRVKPLMNLESLARAGLAAVYTQKFLKFAEADAVRLFFLNGVPDRNAAKQAWRYSEGWIAALWLCLLNKKTGGDMPPSQDIEKLLDEAVFSRHSATEQEFLMMLSVLGSFTAGEAESLTLRADADKLLRDMSNGNAFIRHDDSGEKYVLHSIFRDFLGKKLAAREDVNTPELHRRAAECHIRRRDSLPAFRMLIKAGRDEDLQRILEVALSDSRQSLFSVKRGELLPIMEKIPWRLRLKQPLGYLHFVWLCFDDEIDDSFSVGLFEEMAKRFAEAKEIPAHLRRRLAGEAEFMRAWIYTNVEPELVAPRYKKAYKLLDSPSITRYELRCWNFGAPHMLFVYLPEGVRYSGRFDAMAKACAPLSVLTGGVIEGCDYICSAEYHLERGEFEAAASLIDDLDQILEFPRNMTSLVMARFIRARLSAIAGGEKRAAAILADLLHDIEATDSSEHIQCAELALGYILAAYGQPDAAPRWLRDCDIFERPYGATRILGFMATVCGKLLLAKGDMDGLAAFLAAKPDIFGQAGFTFSRIHAAAFRAILAWHRQDADMALDSMREAVDLSRPEGFVLPLAEYGGHVLPIARRLAKKTPGDILLKKIIDAAKQIEVVQRRREIKTERGLTAREHDIMRLVVKGKSTAAIAKQLTLTQSAVKYSAALAYRKMGASNRAEAAGLFPLSLEKQRNSGTSDEAPGDGTARRDEPPDAFRFSPRAGRNGDLRSAFDLFKHPASGKTMALRFEEIRSSVQLLPWPVRLMQPMAYLAFLWRYFRVFDRVTSGVELDEAEYRLARAKTKAKGLDGRIAGEIALIRSLLHAHDAEAVWDGHDAALKLLRGPSQLYSRETSWTFGNPHFTFAAVREPGGFGELAKRTAAASNILGALSNGAFTSLDAAFRMERLLERGETDDARAILSELENRDDDMQTLILAAFSRARLFLAGGESDRAVESLERLLPRVRSLDSFEHSESLDLALGYVHAHLGRVDAVPQWLRAGKIGVPPHGATARLPFAAVVYAKSLLAARDYARLGAAARTMPIRFGRYDSLLGRIHAKALEAIAERYCRREGEALARLAEALELARPDGLVFSIAEYRVQILPLLRRLHRDNPGDDHIERAALFAKQKYRRPAPGKEDAKDNRILTLRDREIMRYVIRGESNQAIARKLGVSGARINKALIGIYKTLNVSNRAEASRRFAMEYGGQ